MTTSTDSLYGIDTGSLRQIAYRLGGRARARRHARFFPLTCLPEGGRVLDVGCGELGLRVFAPDLDITGVDLEHRPDYPGPFVVADATEKLPFADGEFDLVYCNSVIEHIDPPKRAAFAKEIRRVARGWFVQTPAFSFPIEPHALLPIAHWLPVRIRPYYWRLGATPEWEEISLLRRSEMEDLFGPALPERVGPLTKSWVSIQPARPNTAV